MKPTLVQPDMRYWRMQPDARLRPWVLCYFVVEPMPSMVQTEHTDQLLIPDGHAEIVFNLGDPYERWQSGQSAPRDVMRRSYLIGGRAQSAWTRNHRPVHLAGVKLDPRLLRAMIRVPLSEFSDATLSLRDLNEQVLLELEDAVASAGSALAVQMLLDDFFLRLLARVQLSDPAISGLLNDVRAQRGALSIMDWCRAHGVDPKRLERRFSDVVGITPKRYARVVRFKHSYHQLIAAGRNATALHLDGYYDQSHFNKDFKEFIGVAPRIRLGGGMTHLTRVCDHLLQGELA